MIIHRAQDRGMTRESWLDSRHSFSFNNYYDPAKTNFGALRVLNEDFIQAGKGFGTHGHANMEIVTIVLSGVLEHKDSAGGHGIIRAGDVQRMSAGTGVFHSEYAGNEDVHLLQIWIDTKERNIPPSYEQKSFRLTKKFAVIVNGEKNGAVYIHQDARFLMGELDEEEKYRAKRAYLFVIEGKIKIGTTTLEKSDAAGLVNEEVTIEPVQKAKILLIELP